MSNKKITTRELIVNKALEMYNTYGVEYVGVRELAKELNIKGGNITYYFPTKNDLIREISERLTQSNTEILSLFKAKGIYEFLHINRQLYFNQYKYRAYFISLPLWLQQDTELAQKYREGLALRKKTFEKELQFLVNEDYIKLLTGNDMILIQDTLAATGRLWISEATLDGLIENETVAVNTYLRRMAGILNLIATDKGKADIIRFLTDTQ